MTWPPLVTAPKDGPTVGRGDRRTTPLRRIHTVQPRRLRVPSPLCGVSPVGLPAPQPSLGNIILAAILGPQTVDSRTATGHTSGARLSTPHASATLELPGWRRLQAIQHPVPLLQSLRTLVAVNPSPCGLPDILVRSRSFHRQRVTATNGLRAGQTGRRERRGGLRVRPGLLEWPQGALPGHVVAVIYLARLRVGQTRGPWIQLMTPRADVKRGALFIS